MSGTPTGIAAAGPTLALAATHYRAGEFHSAESVCRHLIAIGADMADAAHLLGVLLLDRDLFAEAAIWLRLSVGLLDTNAEASGNLGRPALVPNVTRKQSRPMTQRSGWPVPRPIDW